MARHPNGQIPRNTLVKRGNYHYATPGTWAKWDSLVADVQRNEGVTLRITEGLNVYRDYEGQVFARNNACAAGRCNDAAVPGTSSHGGVYNGRDSLAIDVANWGLLGQAKWYDYCRKHGFEPGFFDWEPWHIIDWEPYRSVPSGGGSSSTPNINIYLSEEEGMYDLINVQGKSGAYRAGTFAIMRSNPAAGSVLFAKRITFDSFVKGDHPTLDNAALDRWKSTMKFHDL